MKYRVELEYTMAFKQDVEADNVAEATYFVMKTITCGGKAQVVPHDGTIRIKKLDE